jgi:hypothetical protein
MSLTTLNKVADRIDLLSKNCTDKMITVKDISFDDLNTVRIANQPFTMRHMAQQGFSYRLGIPMQYLKKCPSDIKGRSKF